MQALVERLSTPEFPVNLRVVDVPDDWGHAVELASYRAVQEGLTNALKHGDGRGAEVVLTGGDGVLLVEVANGLVPGAPRGLPATGHGLPGLRDRLDQIGAQLEVHQDDARFRLCCSLPITDASVPVGP